MTITSSFVDDGSTDATYRIIKDGTKGIRNMGVVHHDMNQGKGHAVKYGITSVQSANGIVLWTVILPTRSLCLKPLKKG